MNYTDRLKPDDISLTTYLENLMKKKYQIPTFQREVVWKQENVKKLWDSIYKFYPLGSILIWTTEQKLQNHRDIGGHEISDMDSNKIEYHYILDGQQRTTSLLTSLYGGKIKGKEGFDPTIYVDLSITTDDETDDELYKKRFLFMSEIDDKNGTIRQNMVRNASFKEGLIVTLKEIKYNFDDLLIRLMMHPNVNNNFQDPIIKELRKIKGVLDNYKISMIEVKGIQVSEVCQIFERINQAGKPLDIFDIVVAKTFKPEIKETEAINPETKETETTPAEKGFYLRDLIGDFRAINNSEFLKISDLDYLQTIAVIIKHNVPDSGVENITDRFLNEIKTEHILAVWDETKKALLKTFDFFENNLHIKTPSLIPFRYFYFGITAYFYQNSSPDYDLLKKYFWYNSFHNEDLLTNTTHLNKHVEFLKKAKEGETEPFESFVIDKEKLRAATYSTRGRLSRAILALYSNAKPKDWEYCDREVLAQNLFFSLDKPNLHHIFPTNSEFVINNQHKNKITSNSLMNIAYLTQITNLDITNRNPLEYINGLDKPEFEKILGSHLISDEILEWARSGEFPDNAIDQFIESRVNNIITNLKDKLQGITFRVIDTEISQQENIEKQIENA